MTSRQMTAQVNSTDTQWFSALQLAEKPGMPTTEQAVRLRAKKSAWISRERVGRGGGREYALESLPAETQAALILSSQPSHPTAVLSSPASPHADEASYNLESLQLHYDRASQKARDEAERATRACIAVQQLRAQGLRLVAAIENTALGCGIAPGTLKSWWYRIETQPREHWAMLLIDGYVGRTATADCDPAAWDFYKGHYLTRKATTHASCYRRLQELALTKGWVIPSAKTLQRRMDREVSQFTQVFTREGAEALSKLFPAQDRDKSCFAAGQAVNGDGLKFDMLWVKFSDGEILNTTTVWFWQDIFSGKIVAWRPGKTENTDLFRLATYDLTAICLPEHVWMDNTTVAANKAMTGGAEFRHRFHKRSDDLTGALVQLGMTPHFTDPSVEANKGSKPIERAFGIGGLHGEVATHPQFSNRGYSKATAIPFEEFKAVLDAEVARFNAREGRRSRVCGGILSFDQAWQQSFGQALVRKASDAQRRILLLMPEVVMASGRDGVVTIKAGRGPQGVNRYWSEHLSGLRGQKVAVYYDPDNLSADAHIYALDGRYLFSAQHLATAAFNDTDSGREWNKNKQRLLKAKKHAARAESRMTDLERAAIYGQVKPPEQPAPAAAGNVVAGHFSRTVNPERDQLKQAVGADFDQRFVERVEQMKKLRDAG